MKNKKENFFKKDAPMNSRYFTFAQISINGTKEYNYPIVWGMDKGMYCASINQIPGCFRTGDSIEEVTKKIYKAATTFFLLTGGHIIPEEVEEDDL
jgi:predicted RNase H-like HicB family nuclease